MHLSQHKEIDFVPQSSGLYIVIAFSWIMHVAE